jgi:energy-coupling factor transport system substrate-specific component
MLALTLIPLAVAINLGIGTVVKALQFPLFLDAIGTLIAVVLLGWQAGVVVGILSCILAGSLLNPFLVYYTGTAIVIALYAHLVARLGGFRQLWSVVLAGAVLGVVATAVSAPVTYFVFGGATGNGSSLVTGLFASMGHQILESILLSGVSIEPIDKGLQCLLAWFALRSIPQGLLLNFQEGSLRQNGFFEFQAAG